MHTNTMRPPCRVERIPPVAQIPPTLHHKPRLPARRVREEMAAHAPIRRAGCAHLRKRILPASAHDVVDRGHEARVAVF